MIIEEKLTVTSADWSEAAKFLADHLDLSKSKIKDAMNKGAVWLQRGKKRSRLRRARTELFPGDVVEVYYNEAILVPIPAEVELVDDAVDYSVWNKPSGMLAQGTDWGDFNSVMRQVELVCQHQRQVFLVHRLDREASGLMLIAHNKRAAADLSQLFQSGDIQKRYRIEVVGEVAEEGVIETELDGKSAHTEYRRVSYSEHSDTSKVDVWIKTGRKHQIRRHFDSIGHPVVGDPRYGENNKNRQGMKLKAVELEFDCPLTGKHQKFSLY